MPRLPRPRPDDPRPGQESVWSFPRPARVEPTLRHLRVEFGGRVLAETRRGFRTVETSLPPSYYFPPSDVDMGSLRRIADESLCEWKGSAAYFDVVSGERIVRRAAWTYPAPTGAFVSIRNCIAFYARGMDRCLVDGAEVLPQAGDFYGGWITADLAGPFKGPPGTEGW